MGVELQKQKDNLYKIPMVFHLFFFRYSVILENILVKHPQSKTPKWTRAGRVTEGS